MADQVMKIIVGMEFSQESIDRAKEQLRQIYGDGIQFEFVRQGENTDMKKASADAKEDSNSLKESFAKYVKENKKELGVKALKGTEQAITASLKKGFGIVEDIYSRLKAASPLLQAIESLFNLAMTLFFLPLGNKLGEILIPATLELVDKVVDLWDKFEGKSLSEMFSIAINEGVKLFGEYFISIGDTLKEQGGLLSGIGNLLTVIGEFIQGPGVDVLNAILNTISFVMTYFREFVSLWIAMKVTELTIQGMGFLSQIGVGIVPASAGIAIALASAGTFMAAEGIQYGAMAEGGRVPATPGGTLRLLGEGGEDEYVVPESKLGNISGGSITYNIYGYTDSELKQIINDTVNEQISQSRIRSGF